ncbi:tetratricopeptide repeat protein [Roseimicrobium gellanilyticum]|uniref:tetratricopeptide repeat protein n=1 Tax=Roseimicrobium gellanilyticum TaxID=748857 RepID=UPI0011BE8B16|nr:hypothetical protein [Roseimicrobium gellanilyticum]
MLTLDKEHTNLAPDADLNEFEKLADMVSLIKGNDIPGAVSAYHQLSPEMKNQRVPTMLHLLILRRLPDVEAYKDALKEAAKVHQEPSFQYMLLDLYLLEKNYTKAAECQDTLMTLTGKDAVLLATKALFQMHGGSKEDARKTMLEALALEPDCISVHDRAIDVLREAGDHKALADSMRFMEEQTTYRFKGELSDPRWADFLKSLESAPWR